MFGISISGELIDATPVSGTTPNALQCLMRNSDCELSVPSQVVLLGDPKIGMRQQRRRFDGVLRIIEHKGRRCRGAERMRSDGFTECIGSPALDDFADGLVAYRQPADPDPQVVRMRGRFGRRR